MKYVVFLRAINVGGHAVIKMTDLKKRFEAAGLENVQTYIQSGNVIFESTKTAETLERLLGHQLENAAEYKVELFVRTLRSVQSIVETSPFTAEGDETVFVSFLQKPLTGSQQEVLSSLRSEVDDFTARGGEIYHLRRDREKSILARKSLEKILKTSSTTRSLTTLRKIVEKYG